MALVTFGELTFELQRKGIKNLHINVLPLMDGCVYPRLLLCQIPPFELQWCEDWPGFDSSRRRLLPSRARASARCVAERPIIFGDEVTGWM